MLLLPGGAGELSGPLSSGESGEASQSRLKVLTIHCGKVTRSQFLLGGPSDAGVLVCVVEE